MFKKVLKWLHVTCSNGKLSILSCQDGLVFNPTISVCDYPHNVPQCGGSVVPPVTEPPTLAPTTTNEGSGFPPAAESKYLWVRCITLHCITETTTIPPTTSHEGSGNPPTPTPVTCTDKNGQPITGPPFANSADCSHYYQCSNGNLYSMACPAGLVFNPIYEYCDWPANVPGC
ncbi:chondroitin proteoglycan 1-like [Ciona intestinalis]